MIFKSRLNILVIFATLSIFVLITQTSVNSASASLLGVKTPIWQTSLSAYSKTCTDGTLNCQFSSPALADLDNDGKLDIVVGTNKGYVVVVRHNGSILWARDIAPAFGLAANTHKIRSSPAIADIDNDGLPEVVVGAGNSSPCNPVYEGGMIVLEHNGVVKSGWPQLTQDENSDGCRDGLVSTPALANLDNDPQLEIVAGSFDNRIYAWNHNGTLLPGFPSDSFHAQRFDWANLRGKTADTIWSSPAIADLDTNGENEILIGTDEGMFDIGWAGAEFMREWVNWDCYYTLPPGWPITPGKYCGGSLYGLSSDGALLPNFPRYYYEAVFSSPIIVDANGDGAMEIFMGQGDFYYNNSPSRPTDGFRLYGMDASGNELPGWGGGKLLNGSVNAIPAAGDITGDGNLEIIVGSMGRSLYAFHANGSLVSGFPMTPRQEVGQISPKIATSAVTGDYDGDGKDEIFLNTAWSTVVVDGNGSQLTGDNFPNNSLPIFYSYGSLLNSPAVGDIDNDGELELITQNSTVFAFDLPNASDQATWPLLKGNSARTSTIEADAFLNVGAKSLTIIHDSANNNDILGSFSVINQGTADVDWNANSSGNLSLQKNAGTLSGFESEQVNFTIPRNGLNDGSHNYTITVTATSEGETVPGSPTNVAVTVIIADFEHIYLPIMRK